MWVIFIVSGVRGQVAGEERTGFRKGLIYQVNNPTFFSAIPEPYFETIAPLFVINKGTIIQNYFVL
jgi:hypothetical protein